MMIKKMMSLAIGLSLVTGVMAQTITLPQVSQKAKVSQQVGISTVKIIYHSPAVNDRAIWGSLVPYDQIWRAGANECTLIYFSDDVKVEGQYLNAGGYGLYMIPHENAVDILFTSATKNWGSIPPTKDQIVLQVTVTPKEMPHQEWLSYDFTDRGGNDVTAVLKWEKWMIPFNLEFDVDEIVLNNIREELNGLAGFGYLGREQAARYCLTNDIALDDAMNWINGSIGSEKRFSNLMVKVGLLEKAGKSEEAKKLSKEALAIATPVQVNIYGYQLLNGGEFDKAIAVFLNNIETTPKSHPFYWGFVDSVGEAYLRKGDRKNAIKYYSKAKEYAPENRQGYLDGVINGIKEDM